MQEDESSQTRQKEEHTSGAWNAKAKIAKAEKAIGRPGLGLKNKLRKRDNLNTINEIL